MSIPVLLLVLSFHMLATPLLSAQTTSKEPEPLNLPQWAKDLRRAEIVAFGSLPFTLFFATTAMDTFRYINHGNDSRYAPWHLKGAGAVSMNTNEAVITIMSAVGASLLVSLADHLIVRYKRRKAEQEQLQLPKGDPIIIRRPYPQVESPAGETDNFPEAETGRSGEGIPTGGP
jgi:hypothetical protein